MQGYELEFFMEQNRRKDHQALYEWLLDVAKNQGIAGATVFMGAMGFGHHSAVHSTHFFELADQPVMVKMVVAENEAKHLFDFLAQANEHLFYVKIAVEFGTLGTIAATNAA